MSRRRREPTAFGVWLKAWRDERGLSQAHLAAILGVTAGHVAHLEQGYRHLSADGAQALLGYRDLPLTEIAAYRAWSAGTGPRPVSAGPAPVLGPAEDPPSVPPQVPEIPAAPPPAQQEPVALPPGPPALPPTPLPPTMVAQPLIAPLWRVGLQQRLVVWIYILRRAFLLYPVRSQVARAAQRALWGWSVLVVIQSFMWASAPGPMMGITIAFVLATMLGMQARPWLVYRMRGGQNLVHAVIQLTTGSVLGIFGGSIVFSILGTALSLVGDKALTTLLSVLL